MARQPLPEAAVHHRPDLLQQAVSAPSSSAGVGRTSYVWTSRTTSTTAASTTTAKRSGSVTRL